MVKEKVQKKGVKKADLKDLSKDLKGVSKKIDDALKEVEEAMKGL